MKVLRFVDGRLTSSVGSDITFVIVHSSMPILLPIDLFRVSTAEPLSISFKPRTRSVYTYTWPPTHSVYIVELRPPLPWRTLILLPSLTAVVSRECRRVFCPRRIAARPEYWRRHRVVWTLQCLWNGVKLDFKNSVVLYLSTNRLIVLNGVSKRLCVKW